MTSRIGLEVYRSYLYIFGLKYNMTGPTLGWSPREGLWVDRLMRLGDGGQQPQKPEIPDQPETSAGAAFPKVQVPRLEDVTIIEMQDI